MKMNKLNLSSLLLAMIIGFSACTGKGGQKKTEAGVEYFRSAQFSETPFDLEKGSHKITEGEARTVNSYKFTTDDAGRLVSVEYQRGDSLLGNSSLGGASKIVYEYKDNKQIKSYYNRKNERIESAGVYSAEYTLDDEGVRTGLKFFGKNGEPVENRNKINNYVWTMLPDGMLKELRYNLEGKETVMNPFCPFYELRFTYNEKGYVTRMANYMADTLYNCTAENCGDIGVSYFSFKSNEAGDVETFEVFNVNGQMSNLYWGWSKRLNKYDPNGYVLETAYLDQDNEYIGGKSIPVTQYTYDEHGSVVEVKSMDKERKVINNPETGVAITEYKYDEVGNRTETLLFDKDRNPVKK
jgi:hypothetical protein